MTRFANLVRRKLPSDLRFLTIDRSMRSRVLYGCLIKY